MCDYWTQPAPWAGPKSDREGESATGTTQGWNDLSGWVSGACRGLQPRTRAGTTGKVESPVAFLI